MGSPIGRGLADSGSLQVLHPKFNGQQTPVSSKAASGSLMLNLSGASWVTYYGNMLPDIGCSRSQTMRLSMEYAKAILANNVR